MQNTFVSNETLSTTSSYAQSEYIQKWSQLLLTWINKCIVNKETKTLSIQNLRDSIKKYKGNLIQGSKDDMNYNYEDVETFLDDKYPGLQLRNYNNDDDYPKKFYIMTSALLFYLCLNSKDGLAIRDICNYLHVTEQVILLRFCENLKGNDVTYNNIINSIAESIESAAKDKTKSNHLPSETICIECSQQSSALSSSASTCPVSFKLEPSKTPSASSLGSEIASATSDVLILSNFESFQSLLGLEIEDTVPYKERRPKTTIPKASGILLKCKPDCNCKTEKFKEKTSLNPSWNTSSSEAVVDNIILSEPKPLEKQFGELLNKYMTPWIYKGDHSEPTLHDDEATSLSSLLTQGKEVVGNKCTRNGGQVNSTRRRSFISK